MIIFLSGMKNARHGVHASVVVMVKLKVGRSVNTGHIRRSLAGNSHLRSVLHGYTGESFLQ